MADNNTATPLLYKIDDVIPLLNLGRTAVFDLVRLGRLKSVKVGRSRRIPAEWLNEFISTLMTEEAA